MHNMTRIFGCAALVLSAGLWIAFFTPAPVSAATKIFEQGGWVVSGAADTAANARMMRVSVNGTFVGRFSELKVFRMTGAGNYPQVFSVKGSGV